MPKALLALVLSDLGQDAAKVLGAERGYQVEYTTSYDVAPEDEFRMAVGYAGLLF